MRVARQNGQTTPGLHLTNETWVPYHSLRPYVSLYNVYMPQQTCLKEKESERQGTTCVGLACVIPALLFTCIVEEKPALVDRKARCIDVTVISVVLDRLRNPFKNTHTHVQHGATGPLKPGVTNALRSSVNKWIQQLQTRKHILLSLVKRLK